MVGRLQTHFCLYGKRDNKMEKIIYATCGVCGTQHQFHEHDWLVNIYSRFKCDCCGKLRVFKYDTSKQKEKESQDKHRKRST